MSLSFETSLETWTTAAIINWKRNDERRVVQGLYGSVFAGFLGPDLWCMGELLVGEV